MKKINKLNKQKDLLKKIIAGTTLSSVMLASGCGTMGFGETSKYNKAILSFGDKNIVVDINGFVRWNDYNVELKLTDGTSMTGHPRDIRLYNSKSESMREYEETLSPIYVSSEGYMAENKPKLDSALVQEGENFAYIPIKTYIRWDENKTQLILEDGTSLYVNPADLTLYSSDSFVMYQIKSEALKNNKRKAL